jgi:hypothetical protein
MAMQAGVSTKIEESTTSGRGRQCLDRSVWYSGWLMTFLATAEDTQGKFALIESVGRKGNGPPAHIHHREEESLYAGRRDDRFGWRSHHQGHTRHIGSRTTRYGALFRSRIGTVAGPHPAHSCRIGRMVQRIQRAGAGQAINLTPPRISTASPAVPSKWSFWPSVSAAKR